MASSEEMYYTVSSLNLLRPWS